jgi:uncharacterized repeat protein (TIGR03803 family)
MSKLSLLRILGFCCVLCALAVIGWPAETFTTLVRFSGATGQFPNGPLVQGLDGNFYGTTAQGGAQGDGTVFEITPAGTLTTLYNFCSQPNCADGSLPAAGLVQATDGNFYGTTEAGGASSTCDQQPCGDGTVFEITANGELTILHSFDDTDGASPNGLMQAANGNFYGTANVGGENNDGTVFEITPAGTLTTLYSFCSQPACTDGATPIANLIQASNGKFYGTTTRGGENHAGTVFEITPAGMLTVLYGFCSQPACADGGAPVAGLVQATNGNFYGTTRGSGKSGDGAADNGSVFEITSAGKLTTVYTFCSLADCIDGLDPYGGLIQATDGNFYGTTALGGAYVDGQFSIGAGTVYELAIGGKLTTLYNFCSQPGCTDGDGSYEPLLQATNGNFYGTTNFGGASASYGTVFSLAAGLRPFVEALPTSGKVGAAVIILGNNLSAATRVSFHGTPAKFKVISSTEITTTVPSGATTGPVAVTTPSRALTSNVNFNVTPTMASRSPTSGPIATTVGD